MSRPADPVPGLTSASVRGIAAVVVTNSSLLLAGLLYMGWSYTDGLWGYFHLNPLDMGIGIVEYVLRSLNLFSPLLVIAAALFIVLSTGRTWDLDLTRVAAHARKLIARILGGHERLAAPAAVRRLRTSRELMITTGMTVTIAGLALAWLAGKIFISTYLLLSLLGVGPLLLTWPTRAHRHGRGLYALAITVAAVCALWAGSLYAYGKGVRDAQAMVRNLPGGTAVAVYSAQPLALSGPQVIVQNFGASFRYRYCYQGLRLLTARSGTYYLIPAGWTPRLDITYILDDSDQIRIEIYSAQEVVH